MIWGNVYIFSQSHTAQMQLTSTLSDQHPPPILITVSLVKMTPRENDFHNTYFQSVISAMPSASESSAQSTQRACCTYTPLCTSALLETPKANMSQLSTQPLEIMETVDKTVNSLTPTTDSKSQNTACQRHIGSQALKCAAFTHNF